MTKTEEFAEAFAQAVRDAFSAPWAYGPTSDPHKLESIRPSWSEEEVRRGWTKPDPRVAVVGTEYAWVQDPYLSDEDHKLWEDVAKRLTRDGWGYVNWESINAAVHVMYIDIQPPWASILMKNLKER